ncbi:MAG: hypothetical protein KKC19_04175 [Nanoarchaeota archaeon]|nr:hypothetical protein [Nanoarchaeota archaeon]
MDFLWHKVSEKEWEGIRVEAERVMNNFSKKLERVKGNLVESFFGEEVFEREEGKVPCAEIDREVMFGNAPKKNDDSIIAERGGW